MGLPTTVVPIFPLPDVTFFPHTLLPLHVFEARYRAMVMDALARDRRLCVVKLEPGYEASYAGKPAVHAVFWNQLSDGEGAELPFGGLIDSQGAPKPGMSVVAALTRKHLESPS